MRHTMHPRWRVGITSNLSVTPAIDMSCKRSPAMTWDKGAVLSSPCQIRGRENRPFVPLCLCFVPDGEVVGAFPVKGYVYERIYRYTPIPFPTPSPYRHLIPFWRIACQYLLDPRVYPETKQSSAGRVILVGELEQYHGG